nr:HAD-IA family hydrolase [uncultured Methanoregula sp.]
MYSSIILDFDGVVVESVAIKTEAFRELFSFSPEHVAEIENFHLQNGGMSRYDKFEYIYRNILNERLTDEKKEELSERFSMLVMQKVIKAPFVYGAEIFIKKYSQKTSLFIVSATPQTELEQILLGKGIISFFKKVYGSPVKKQDHIRNIISQSQNDPSSVLFVGDAINDWRAANECHINFIARDNSETKKMFLNLPNVEKIVSDLHELSEYLGE